LEPSRVTKVIPTLAEFPISEKLDGSQSA